jgi:hypothetical protein
MKKLALILALLLIPCSAAFGLEMLDNNAMDSITGQAGVNIAVDDIQMFINIEKMAWIDCDGFASWEGKGTCGGAAGALVLNNFQIDVLNINAIVGASALTASNSLPLYSTTCGSIDLFYDYGTSAKADGCMLNSAVTGDIQNLGLNNYTGALGQNSAFTPHFLTIDVTDELPASTEGAQYWESHAWTSAAVSLGTSGLGDSDSTIGGVLIGLPTVEIYINALSFTPMYDGDIGGADSAAMNDDSITDINGDVRTFGTIYMEGITFTVLSGWIEISPK